MSHPCNRHISAKIEAKKTWMSTINSMSKKKPHSILFTGGYLLRRWRSIMVKQWTRSCKTRQVLVRVPSISGCQAFDVQISRLHIQFKRIGNDCRVRFHVLRLSPFPTWPMQYWAQLCRGTLSAEKQKCCHYQIFLYLHILTSTDPVPEPVIAQQILSRAPLLGIPLQHFSDKR